MISFYFTEDNQFHRENMDERKNLLRTYLDGNLEREKQALYALQSLMHRLEHPNSKFSFSSSFSFFDVCKVRTGTGL